jgi:hypothetical protein
LLRGGAQHGRVPIFLFFLLVCHRTEGAVLILHLNRHNSVCVARCTQLWHNVRQLLHCARYDATLHHLPTECRAECSAHTIQSGIRRYSMQWRIASSVGCTTDFAAVTFASRQSFLTLLPAQHAKQHCTCSPPHRCQREHARGAGQHTSERACRHYRCTLSIRSHRDGAQLCAANWMPTGVSVILSNAQRTAPLSLNSLVLDVPANANANADVDTQLGFREPSRAEPSRAEPSRAEPSQGCTR